MKRAILLLVVVVGGAFYLGWFTFTTSNDPTGHAEHVNILIDKDKVHEDEARALEKLHSFENQIQEKNRASGTASPAAGQSANVPQGLPEPSLGAGQTSGLAPLPAPTAGNAYDAPEERQPRGRPVAETAAESFSRGFQ
ncbi:MAG TPA: hypothetical protein VNH11_12715 [Pirellulales bacterium]|nr:hypothetical protein [Pirellulales bacterium]